MKLTNFELFNVVQTLNHYSEKKLPQKISYAIMKNAYLLKDDIEIYEESMRKIIDSYSEFIIKDRYLPSGPPLVDEDHMGDYTKEIDDLLSIEVDVDLYSIDESTFDYEDSERYDAMSARDIMRLRAILCRE